MGVDDDGFEMRRDDDVMTVEMEMVIPQESVIIGVVSKLGSDISQDDSGERTMIIERSQWCDEPMNTIVFVLHDEPRHHHRMCRGVTQTYKIMINKCHSIVIEYLLATTLSM